MPGAPEFASAFSGTGAGLLSVCESSCRQHVALSPGRGKEEEALYFLGAGEDAEDVVAAGAGEVQKV